MRSRNGVEKGRRGESGNGPQLSAPALVPDSENPADALRRRSGEFATENFAEITLLLFYRPEFQVNAASLLRD
jgi:hypothetical protein